MEMSKREFRVVLVSMSTLVLMYVVSMPLSSPTPLLKKNYLSFVIIHLS
jgi:hypothetical protein